MSFHVTYNFVQGYDLGQKKIVASEVDQNFADIEGYINNSSVNIVDTQTITGDKTFSGDTTFSGNVTLPASAVSGTSVALDGSNVSSIESTLSTYMAHAAMPSVEGIWLSVPSGNATFTYTVPADGYLWAGCSRANQSNSVSIYKINFSGQRCISPNGGWTTEAMLPVLSGETYTLEFFSGDAQFDSKWAKFIYANGSAPTV